MASVFSFSCQKFRIIQKKLESYMNHKEIYVSLEVGGKTVLEITVEYWMGGLSGKPIDKKGV